MKDLDGKWDSEEDTRMQEAHEKRLEEITQDKTQVYDGADIDRIISWVFTQKKRADGHEIIISRVEFEVDDESEDIRMLIRYKELIKP